MTVTTVACPLPGVFYRRPSPAEPPFKAEGDPVTAGEMVGLVEVMKTFTPVVVEMAGRMLRFHVGDEEPVMAGQPLYDLET